MNDSTEANGDDLSGHALCRKVADDAKRHARPGLPESDPAHRLARARREERRRAWRALNASVPAAGVPGRVPYVGEYCPGAALRFWDKHLVLSEFMSETRAYANALLGAVDSGAECVDVWAQTVAGFAKLNERAEAEGIAE